MGGTPEPQVTQVETMGPEQKRFLNTMLDFFPQVMGGQTIGQAWGGPGQESYKPFTIGEGKGGTVPKGGGGGRTSSERGTRGSPVDEVLTKPFVSPFTQGQTGNYPKPKMR